MTTPKIEASKALAGLINAAARDLVAEGLGYADAAYISDVAERLGLPLEQLHTAVHGLMTSGDVEFRRADLRDHDRAKVRASEWQHPKLRTSVVHLVVAR